MKKLKVIAGLLLVVTLLVAVSCAQATTKSGEGSIGGQPSTVGSGRSTVPVAPAPPPEISMNDASMAGAPPPVVIAAQDLSSGQDTERMIVRTGNISLVVVDVPAAIEQITTMADGFKGYVVSSNVWNQGERLAGSISIRVAVEDFDNAMRALRALAVEVASESSNSKDVTEEYVDLSAQLKNLEATEAQLLKIMEKAEKVEDVLNVQRELSRTRGEIEQTKARMQYLERTSSTSLIQVGLEQSSLAVKLTASTTVVKEGEKIVFRSDIAGGFAPYSYEWDFGDGSTSTDVVPAHAYKADGRYTVSLTVTDDRGNTDTETRTDYITVLPGWSVGNIAGGAWNGLVIFGRVLANVLIWIGIFSPVWIVIGGIAYWVYRRRMKKAH